MSQGFSNESNMTQNVTSKKMRDYGVPVFSRLCMTLERYCGVRVFNKKKYTTFYYKNLGSFM